MKTNSPSLRKAALLVASLDRDTADRLLDQMSPRQAALVRRALVELGDIDPDEQDEVIGEFFRAGPRIAVDEPPGIDLDGQLARRLAASPRRPPDEDQEQDRPPFRFLHEAKCEKLSPFLAGEHPQTIALVLSHLPPERALGVLATLAGTLQADVIRRLVDLDEADPRILREVERGLQSRILEQVKSERLRAAGLVAVAGILEAADPVLRRQILGNLACFDPPLAGKLRTDQFEFSQLSDASPAALATLVQSAERHVAVLALAGATPRLVERVLAGLPAADALLLQQDVENIGPTRLSDVEEAQSQMAELAQQLAWLGRMELPASRAPVLV